MGRLNAVLVMLVLLIMAPGALAEDGIKRHWDDFWWTPAQQGQHAFERGEFEVAAERYHDPMQIGSAYFRAGQFEAATAAFGRVNTPEGFYNMGTAQLMQGDYAGAIGSFDHALAERPGWKEAEQNRSIAEARQENLKPQDQQGAKATEISADEVVFDQDNSNKKNQDEVTTDSAQSLSDQELRALWLRNSQTSPAVFLKAKFRAQLATDSQQETAQ